MNRADHALLLEMTDRDLADIGISRSDLPRLCADHAFGSYFYDAFLCEDSIVYGRTPLRHGGPVVYGDCWTTESGFLTSLVRGAAALSAVLITWAIVSLLGGPHIEGHPEAPAVGQGRDNASTDAT